MIIKTSNPFGVILLMVDFNFKEKYTIDDLIEIVRILRSENGCPWDKEQTHKSIRIDFLEEVYEVIEAIDFESEEMLREELGDVLLQVVFHSQIETEKDSFNFSDVTDDICKKLIIRHPHVFGEVSVSSSEEVLKNWDRIKKDTKGQETFTDTLKSVPRVFPSLLRASKLGKRASRANLDFKNADDALKSLRDEVDELSVAMKTDDTALISEEIGDVIFSAVNVARKSGLNAEELLTQANEKFIARFEKVEQMTIENNENMQDLSADKLDKYWNKAKEDK